LKYIYQKKIILKNRFLKNGGSIFIEKLICCRTLKMLSNDMSIDENWTAVFEIFWKNFLIFFFDNFDFLENDKMDYSNIIIIKKEEAFKFIFDNLKDN
jgi:hypothetical protein